MNGEPLKWLCINFVHLGHSTYLGFFYMDYCYNNAVIHVFLGSLTQLIVPHHKAKYKHSEKEVEEILEFAIVDPPTPADEQQSSETPMTGKICGQALV